MIQTTIDQKAMTALARMTRKTVRRGRNGPVRLMAWFVVLLEAYLTVIYVRAGLGGWQMNLLLGGIMLDDRCYVCRSQGGERWWPYSQIRVVVETRDYFALLLDRKHGQVYNKKGFSWGTEEEFRALIQKKTGLKIQAVR